MRRGGCPHPPAAPAGAEHPRGGSSKGIFRAPARGTFALGGKSTQKRRSNLRFENPFARLHPPRILTAFATRTLCRGNFTEMLHCLCFSFRCRFCSEMQSCAVLYLVCRGGVLRCGAKRNECPWGAPPAVSPSPSPTHIYQRQKHFPTSSPWPPPTFAASRQRRDLIIAQTPGGCFQRGRAAALPLWSFQGEKIFKKRGKSKSPFS